MPREVVRREGSAPSRAGCRPAMLLLHHRRFFKSGRWSWNCANLSGSSDPRTSLYAIQRKNLRAGGVAPPLFTQRAWFYRPGRHIWQSPRTLVESWSGTWDLHPPCGLHRPECELATLSPGKWSGWRDLHPRSPAPKAGALATTLQPEVRAKPPAASDPPRAMIAVWPGKLPARKLVPAARFARALVRF